MAKSTTYQAKTPDRHGRIAYSDAENATWAELIARQRASIPGRACSEYIAALERLELPADRVPQCADVSAVLRDATGWQVQPVAALISFEEFFRMLAERKFPAASFIRRRAELDYLPEPDIFHEIFGHCPLLTDPGFAAFTHAYGQAGLRASKADRVMLARLYWFTVEFGLVEQSHGELRTYGAGIVSSASELAYALDSDAPERKRFEPVDVLRTPYRIDNLQTIYFVIGSFDELFELAGRDLGELIQLARRLGMHAATIPNTRPFERAGDANDRTARRPCHPALRTLRGRCAAT